VSCTVTPKLAPPVFPWESVALQLTVVVPSGNVLPELGEQFAESVPSKMSLADAEKDTAAPEGPVASAVADDGTETSGAVVSRTVTLNESGSDVLPCESVAVQVTVVVPTPKVLPEEGEQSAGKVPSTRSLPVAENETAAPADSVASVVMFPGTDTDGFVVSWTVTLNEALPVLLDESVAEQVTFVVPTAKVSPDEGEQLGVSDPDTVSLADAEKVTTAPDGPVASCVSGEGTVTSGGVVSCTVTVKDSDVVFESESVALHVTSVSVRSKLLPESGAQVTGSEPSSTSVAVGASHVTVAPELDVASARMSDGTPLRTGEPAAAEGAVSSTTADRTTAASAPPPSVRFLTPL
jgi:hypothetical protein